MTYDNNHDSRPRYNLILQKKSPLAVLNLSGAKYNKIGRNWAVLNPFVVSIFGIDVQICLITDYHSSYAGFSMAVFDRRRRVLRLWNCGGNDKGYHEVPTGIV